MKTKTFLIAAVMILALGASAFAQATFTIGSIPVTTVANSGQTEKTGDITLTTVSGSGNSENGTFTITYGVPITAGTTAVPAPIMVTSAAGAGGTAPAVAVLSIDNTNGQLVISIDNTGVPPFTIRVTGVRVATADTGLTELSASISSTGNALTAGETSVKVINAISAAISSVKATPATVNAVTGVSTLAEVDLNVKEGFLTAFGVTSVTDPTQSPTPGGIMVRITLDDNPPPGITLTFPQLADATVGQFTLTDAAGTALAAPLEIDSTSASLVVYYLLTTDSSLVATDTLTIPIGVDVATTPRPLAGGSVSATATFAPIGNPFGGTGTTVLTTPIPRFKAVEEGPATILTVVAANTTLLMPYVTSMIGYDTGIAIANTTMDPGLLAMGFEGAIEQSGDVTFYFYPTMGDPFEYTTSGSSPGSGLDSSGELASGGTYTVLLSDLLDAAGESGDFTGYIIAICNFTNAHGQLFISDFSGFTSNTAALVLGFFHRQITQPEQLGQ